MPVLIAPRGSHRGKRGFAFTAHEFSSVTVPAVPQLAASRVACGLLHGAGATRHGTVGKLKKPRTATAQAGSKIQYFMVFIWQFMCTWQVTAAPACPTDGSHLSAVPMADS